MVRIGNGPEGIHAGIDLEEGNTYQIYDFDWVLVDPVYSDCGAQITGNDIDDKVWILNSPSNVDDEILRIANLSTSSLEIPDCLLEREVTYSFTYRITSPDGNDVLDYDFTIEVLPSPFVMSLSGGNKDHPVYDDIHLIGDV